MKGEKWADIKGFELFYQVSNMGRIKVLDRFFAIHGVYPFCNHQTLLNFNDKERYYRVTLFNRLTGFKKRFTLHRLVGIYFVKNPHNKPFLNHLNSNKHDNRAKNLKWCTQLENTQYHWKNDSHAAYGEKNIAAKLTEVKVKRIRKSLLSAKQLAAFYNVSISAILRIRSRKTWRNVA